MRNNFKVKFLLGVKISCFMADVKRLHINFELYKLITKCLV